MANKRVKCSDCYHNPMDAFIRDHGGEIKITGCEKHLKIMMSFYRAGQFALTKELAKRKEIENAQ